MKTYSAIIARSLLSALTFGPFLSDPTPGVVEEQIQKQYVGSQRILRKFYDTDRLKFDDRGDFRGKAATGSWTLFGNVDIEHVSLTDKALILDGHRNILIFNEDGKRMERKKGDRWAAEIATHAGPGQAMQIESALRNIFVAEGEDLTPLLPDYWQDYIQRLNGRGGKPCEMSEVGDENKNAMPKSGGSVGVTDGKKTHDVPPNYLMAARMAGVEGEIRFRASISKSGDIIKLCLTQALGGGLDDEVARVVRQWKYEPYLLNGEPVEVGTIVTMRFGMRKP